MRVKQTNLLIAVILSGISIILIICMRNISYIGMIYLALIQLVINVYVTKKYITDKVLSFLNIFFMCSFFFHCGQLLKIAFGISGEVPLDVTKYASYSNIVNSFRFYFLAQCAVLDGMLFWRKNSNKENIGKTLNRKNSAIILVLIGVIPRLYIDGLTLINGFANGYSGVYSMVIPQFVYTLAFFFDAGCIIALMDKQNKTNTKILFWIILIYKCITMSTGARQERIVFLIVWVMVYFYWTKKVTVKNIFSMIIIGILGILFINAIGAIRSTTGNSIGDIFSYILGNNGNNMFGNMLGEFGSAMTTLAVTIRDVPKKIHWGMGDSYLAGILSIVPTLASRVGLGSSTTYITKISGTQYFGGSYLGEAYYNFSWFGCILCAILGWWIAKLQGNIDKDIDKNIDKKRMSFDAAFAVIVMISIILLVRGYFTDMVQRLVWVYIVLRLINKD